MCRSCTEQQLHTKKEYKQEANQTAGQAKRSATKIQLKAVRGDIFCRFLNFHKCPTEVDGEVISGVTVDTVGMGVRVKFCDSRLNSGRVIKILAGQIRFTYFCAIFNCILQPTGSRW